MIDYTLVVGVDRKHLEQLSHTWPTWKKHKPSLLSVPMVVFCDRHQVAVKDVRGVVDHPRLTVVEWPLSSFGERYDYRLPNDDKWSNSQRYKMLAGFVHVPPLTVMTRYWLKVDTDTVAITSDDWIDPEWFDACPAIVSQPWGFTKPPDQMLRLDKWVRDNEDSLPMLSSREPLNLCPKGGKDRLNHHRIISWCAFIHTKFTAKAAVWAARTCGAGELPVPSQDGYLWYLAERLGFQIVRANMKHRGWQHWSAMRNVVERSREAMLQ